VRLRVLGDCRRVLGVRLRILGYLAGTTLTVIAVHVVEAGRGMRGWGGEGRRGV
jgi:hypothetical protein